VATIEDYKNKLRQCKTTGEIKAVIDDLDRSFRNENMAMSDQDWPDLELLIRKEILPKCK